MATLKQLIQYLNELYQPELFADFCPNGLQVEGVSKVSSVATAVSASLETIEKAVKQKVQLLIVHHGLFWNRDSQVISGVKKEKIELLLKSGISLMAYHLPMDAHVTFGNNWKAALDLNWTNLKPFYKANGAFIGVQGNIPKQSRKNFKKQLEKYYNHEAIVAFGGKTEIQSAALISGGAYKQLEDAAALGIDCFITGNFDEPAWPKSFEEKINFYALGHSATERVGPKALAKHLQEKLKLITQFIPDENPF